jgi:aspartate racemase
MIKKDVEILKSLGVKFISIPCNTVFYFMREIAAGEELQIVSIVDETARFIKEKYPQVKRVGILATDGTVKSGIYKQALGEVSIDAIYPEAQDQKRLMKIIYSEVKEGDTGDIEGLLSIAEKVKMEMNCDLIILGCTELSVARRGKYIPDYCIDALDILVERSIVLSGKEVRENI